MSYQPKFRIWSSQDRKFWIEGKGVSIATLATSYRELLLYPEIYKFPQWTGLFDKNGKEIYDGDIIKFMGRWDEDGKVLTPDYKPYKVTWFGGGFRAMMINRPRPFMSFHEHNEVLGVGHTDSEIIGNIYENPELLERK